MILFYFEGSLVEFHDIPKVSSEAEGSDQSRSIAIYCTASLMAPKLIFSGLLIFSMSSILLIDVPRPPCTQKILF